MATKYEINTRYGKLVDGELVYSTNPIKYGTKTISCSKTATAQYLKYGYKSIVRADYPEVTETQSVVEIYTEDETHIYISYEVIEENE